MQNAIYFSIFEMLLLITIVINDIFIDIQFRKKYISQFSKLFFITYYEINIIILNLSPILIGTHMFVCKINHDQ